MRGLRPTASCTRVRAQFWLFANEKIPANNSTHRAVPTADVQRVLDVNIMGTYFSYKYAAMQMIKQGTGGRIVGASPANSKS